MGFFDGLRKLFGGKSSDETSEVKCKNEVFELNNCKSLVDFENYFEARFEKGLIKYNELNLLAMKLSDEFGFHKKKAKGMIKKFCRKNGVTIL